jgi:hypothetical protein
VAAQFLLQADAFSCRDALNFNRRTSSIPNEFAPLSYIGGCASSNIGHLRSNFAVANLANRSYCWEALKATLHAMCASFEMKLLSPVF